MSKPSVLAEPILVGREKELEQLQSFLTSAIQGKGNTVFVSGEAGSGKTRLTSEFLNSAMKQGVAVMAGWCLSDSQAPFFPFIEAFNSYYAANVEDEQSISFQQPHLNLEVPIQIGVQEREVNSWLAGPKQAAEIGKAEVLSPQVWKDQALAAVAKTVHTIALQAPVIVFIEDLHWADSASLALLHYLSRAVKDSGRVLLLATFRSEELTADAEGHPHPLAETLRMMRREELFSDIKVSSLNQASVSKLAESMLGSCVQPEFTEKLTVQSGGSPLFIVESLRMLDEHGGLVRDGACVRLDIEKVSIPSKVRDVILRRLGSLRREQRRVLDAAAVIGEEFNVDFLSDVLGQESLGILETLSVISDSTSLVVDAGNCYRFDHARSRETLYEELSPSLRRAYHNRIADRLESTRGKSLPLSDLAYHYAQAENKDKAIRYAIAAGQDALTKWSNLQAIQHFGYALKNVSEDDSEWKKTALEGLGDAYISNSKFGDATKAFDELSSITTGKEKLRAIRKAMEAVYIVGVNPALLQEYAKKAEELGVDDRLEMARILNNRGIKERPKGKEIVNIEGAVRDLTFYEAALKIFEEENSLPDVAEALWRCGAVNCFFGEMQAKGLGQLIRSASIFKELGNTRKETMTMRWLAQGFAYCGLPAEHRTELAKSLRDLEQLGVFTELVIAYTVLAHYDEIDGKLADALSKALKAFEFSKKTDAAWTMFIAYAALIRVYSLLGDLKKANKCLEEQNKLPPEAFASMHSSMVMPSSKAIYCAANGQWEESNHSFGEQLDFAFGLAEYNEINPKGVVNYTTLSRLDYAWVLEQQGRLVEASVQRDDVRTILEQANEKFGHANIQLSVIVPRKAKIGEENEIRLDFVNVGRKPGMLERVEGIAFPELAFSTLPTFCSLQDRTLVMKDKIVGPFEVETIKLKFSTAKAGSYVLNPQFLYLDDLGNTKTFKLNPITITGEPAKPAFEVLPGRLATDTAELDRLLLGGIPKGYSVVLVSPSSEERQRLIENYVKAGLKNNQTTFYLTAEPGNIKALAEEYSSSLFLFVCNPRADLMVRDLPNVYKTKGVDNLTEIDIALTKASRQLNTSSSTPKRACIEIVSDVLLQHHAVTTRKWLSGLVQDLKSKGFTVLVVVDPLISPEEVPAITSLFDGEIRIAERETERGMARVLRVLRLQGQAYLKDEVHLESASLSV